LCFNLFVDVLWQCRSIRLNLLPFARFAALLANGGINWYSGDEIFPAEISKTILWNLDQRNITKDEQSRKLFHEIGMSFFMTGDRQSITLVVPSKFAIIMKSEYTDLTKIIKNFCEKFNIHRSSNETDEVVFSSLKISDFYELEFSEIYL